LLTEMSAEEQAHSIVLATDEDDGDVDDAEE